MSEDTQGLGTGEVVMEEANESQDERTLLLERAKVLGITHNANIGVDKLKAKINAALSGDQTPEDSEEVAAPIEEVKEAVVVKETDAQKRTRIAQEAKVLVRVTVTCLDPKKANEQGELITVRNRFIKRMSKFVLFNKPYHIPKLMLGTLREAKATVQITERVNGRDVKRMAEVPKYNVTVMEPLTEKELERLAKTQALRDNNE